MDDPEKLPEATCPDNEELRKLTPGTAYQLGLIIQNAEASRKQDHATMQHLADELSARVSGILTTNMATIVQIIEGLRNEQREQNRRIADLEAGMITVKNDMRTVKEKLEIPA